MAWILDHLQIILAIAGAIAYWLNARSKEQAGEPTDYDGDGEPDTRPQSGRALREQDPTLLHDENTRRIQDEIRRKIAERNGARPVRPSEPTVSTSQPGHSHREVEASSTPPRMPTAMPAARRREMEESPYSMDETRRAAVERHAASVLENQRELAAQLAALQQRRAEAERTARSMREGRKATIAATANAAGRVRTPDDVSLLSDLRDARSLRKAIVLREVLGTPVGLR